MGTKDYIPSGDNDFHIMQDRVYVEVSINATKWLISDKAISALDPQRSRWNTAIGVFQDPGKRTPSVVQEKNDARAEYEPVLRTFIQGYLMHNPLVTDADRLKMELPIYDRKPTPAPAPETYPKIDVDFSLRARHIIHVRDSKSKGSGRPPHVAGFEIWRRIGGDTEPVVTDMQLVEQAVHSPHTLEYAFTERGKKVWYIIRWVNTRGEKGPWSEIVSAIIA